MYSTCLFCRSGLATNETFATFPVGRRLAYDPARGRLWVVCRRCGRWNLSPLDERWEAIEDAERRIGRARVRAVSGDEITLARLPEGTDLVRIGRPTPRELATWRWGSRLDRRRRRNLAIGAGVAVGGVVAAVGGLAALGVSGAIAFPIAGLIRRAVERGAEMLVTTRLRAPDGSIIAVRPPDLRVTTFGETRSGGISLTIHRQLRPGVVDHGGPVHFAGAEAERALAVLMPAANRGGGTPDEVETALARLTSAPSPRAMIERLARSRTNFTPLADQDSILRVAKAEQENVGLFAMPASIRLAIEMALSEERERSAMEGELTELVAAWREAEEVARIADDLFLPAGVISRLERLKQDR